MNIVDALGALSLQPVLPNSLCLLSLMRRLCTIAMNVGPSWIRLMNWTIVILFLLRVSRMDIGHSSIGTVLPLYAVIFMARDSLVMLSMCSPVVPLLSICLSWWPVVCSTLPL